MKFYFVRHGHATHNAAFDMYKDNKVYRTFDSKDSHLTEKGIAQIKDIVLPKMNRVYSSPIIRCIETSRILVGDNEILYLHDGLMETQGPYPCNWRPDIDTFMRSMKKYNLVNVKEKYEPYTKYYITNVSETTEDIKQRIDKTMNQIKSECAGLDNVLIVTHHDVLKELFGRSFVNGEVYTVEY